MRAEKDKEYKMSEQDYPINPLKKKDCPIKHKVSLLLVEN